MSGSATGDRAALLASIRADLEAEQVDLVGRLEHVAPERWSTPTPAEGWTVGDQVGHLAYFDHAAALAIADSVGFERHLSSLDGVDAPIREHLAQSRSMGPEDIAAWWQRERRALLAELAQVAPDQRIRWYGPDPMSPASFVSARLMETWVHGQDVVDALGVDREPTGRLRHVAHLGVQARRYSYLVRGREMPRSDVHVELRSPSGETWRWGDPGAENVVRGQALDFCLVVTQRRHRDDTWLQTEGAVAEEWMSIAQAYAGPAGPGRPAGQFPRPAIR